MLKRFVINAYEKRFQKELREKLAKKGLLTKVLDNNKKRTDSLIDILKESDNLNTLRSSPGLKTEEEYLAKFRNASHGGPKHSIAVNRAHHLTNFLSEYILNAFQSGRFDSPEIPAEINTELDLNGFGKETFYFEISNVELMSDLSALRIYWYSSGNEKVNRIVEDFLEKKLKSQIRATLAGERIMNYVPKIVFLKDDSRFLINQLDNYLMKLNLETKDKSNEAENYPIDKNLTITTNNNVNNLYGVNVDEVMECIKKGPSSQVDDVCIPEPSENKPACTLEQSSSNFNSSLRAFEINRRMRRERLSKSTLHKLTQLEFEEFKLKNLT
ncbi:hypothetical protein BpHYR1_053583 [Brachionus plicatilis]|uniref:Uncharacterized protein n=1 Tax=Brachionus plicatilis TaxID=10195 RepID=A0A3M7QTL6_BRAPC|nr:hypothetical protein BpHYR1_053583 [Brachionus plicatilis]